MVPVSQQAGDRVRAPTEVEEVAADIRERFHKAEERTNRRATPSPHHSLMIDTIASFR